MARKYFQSRVEETTNLCDNVKHIVMRRDDGEPFAFKPGQFVMIYFPNPDGVQINRSYSISAPPENEGADGRYALCVKRVDFGKGSTLLHSLKPGDEIKTTGPHGRFTIRDEEPEDLVLVATGTGIAPFRAMKDQLREILPHRRVWLLLGVRYEPELLYHDEWKALAEEFENFRYRFVVSRPGERWAGPKGYVDTFVPELKETMDPAKSVVYLCGVPEMVDGMRNQFLEMGMERRAIRSEKYASPPDPAKRVPAPKKS